MKALKPASILLCLVMLCGAVAAHAIRPAKNMVMPLSSTGLAAIVPESFGNWHIDYSAGPVVLPTELEEQQKEIYDQMLVRTYVNSDGHHVMLSIAYGSNQSKAMQVHRPEVCYSSLGFQILQSEKGFLSGLGGIADIPVMRLITAKNTRNEPVTYWIRMGDQVVRGNIELGIARLGYGLRGYVPDGLLFRVSTVTSSNDEGFKTQDQFVRDLMRELNAEQRAALVGRSSLTSTPIAGS